MQVIVRSFVQSLHCSYFRNSQSNFESNIYVYVKDVNHLFVKSPVIYANVHTSSKTPTHIGKNNSEQIL